MAFIEELSSAFHENANRANAIPMEKYMKNLFPYFGIKTGERRQLFISVWKKHEQEVKENSRKITLELYLKAEREFHYCAIEILIKNLKNNYLREDIHLIEKLLITNSWWDSVDTISKYILGRYLLEFPVRTREVVNRFSESENMWLNRSTLLFQLGYKQQTNEKILFGQCLKHAGSKEFFIRKAIGWALREYGKTNPEHVRMFVNTNELSPLSTKEALKNIN